ncbi:MAG: hypothetical protein OXH63_28215 [Gemmatimonadetes bacterium]|nr:hypothetical protein [Gemmatimonadota bacterium]
MKIDRRLARRFAETMLYWRGYLRARDVQQFAGISERTSRRLLSDWRASGLLPIYRPNEQRGLAPADNFDPGENVTDPAVALNLLLVAHRIPGNPFALRSCRGSGQDLSLTATVRSPSVRTIIAAYLNESAVSLIYVAKTGSHEFVFSPSALVRSRGRYHMRGFRADGRDALGARLNDRYVDVVPARALEAWPAKDAEFVGPEKDDDWNAMDESQFVLSPALTNDERLCYEHEYGISETGKLSIQNRRALMPYILEELSERRCWRPDGTSVQIWQQAGGA